MYNKEMLKELAKKWGWVAGVVMLGATQVASAQLGGPTPITLPNPLSANSFQAVVAQISNFLLLIAVPLTAIMALVGGFQMITAGGDPEKFSKGRKTLMYAAIGFAVVLVAGGVASIISNFLTGK
jgi:NAD dependent epimerase/dehydratase family enzyme